MKVKKLLMYIYNDNEAELDVEFITDGSYNNWEKPTNTGAISTPISLGIWLCMQRNSQRPFLIWQKMVREMATSQNSNTWCVYDQRVRLDREARGLPWEVFNIEFYIMAIRARDSNFSGTFVIRDNTFLNCGCNRPFRGSFRPSYRRAR